LAQVHGLREQHSSEEKTRLDLQYFLHPSPLTDLSLLLQTLCTLAMRLFISTSLGIQEAPISEHKQYNVFEANLIQESLHGAHRSQSGTD
jgi:hypothetical protein